MRSRADAALIAERGLRVVAFAALAALLWSVVGPGRRSPRIITIAGTELGRALPAWTVQPRADSFAVRLAGAPTPAQRDWLAALRRAGTGVTWSGAIAAVALERVETVDPAGGTVALVAAPPGSAVILADTLGAIDSARAAGGGATFRVPSTGSALTAALGGVRARALAQAPDPPRHVALIARAGWEAKFIVAALEERGWNVDTRFEIAPGLVVTQGRPWPLDTARHAALVLLDSVSPGDAAAVVTYVRRGGGLVMSTAAARSATLALLAPGVPGARVRASAVSFASDLPRRALSFDRLGVGPRGVVLERQGGATVVAARRAFAGRVVLFGYDDTWRWRLAGGDDAAEAHAGWWSALTSAAAYRPPPPGIVATVARAEGADPAPLASTVFALGPAVRELPRAGAAPEPGRWTALLFGTFLATLLLEWASRRLRGAA